MITKLHDKDVFVTVDKNGQILFTQLEPGTLGALRIAPDGKVSAFSMPGSLADLGNGLQWVQAESASVQALAVTAEEPLKKAKAARDALLAQVARHVGLGRPGLETQEDAEAQPGRLGDFLRAARLPAFAALSALESFSPAEHAFYGLPDEKGLRRRQAAQVYPQFANLLATIGLRLAVEKGEPLEPMLQKRFGLETVKAIRALRGVKRPLHGVDLDQVIMALDVVDGNWIPQDDVEWGAFLDVSKVVNEIALYVAASGTKDLARVIQTLHSSGRGKTKGFEWREYRQRLAEAAGQGAAENLMDAGKDVGNILMAAGKRRQRALLEAAQAANPGAEVDIQAISGQDQEYQALSGAFKAVRNAVSKLVKQIRQAALVGGEIDQALIGEALTAFKGAHALLDDRDDQERCLAAATLLGDHAALMQQDTSREALMIAVRDIRDIVLAFAETVVMPAAANATNERTLKTNALQDKMSERAAAEILFGTSNAINVLESARRFHFDGSRIRQNIAPPRDPGVPAQAQNARTDYGGTWPALVRDRVVIEPRGAGGRPIAIQVLNNSRMCYIEGAWQGICVGWNGYDKRCEQGRIHIVSLFYADEPWAGDQPSPYDDMSFEELTRIAQNRTHPQAPAAPRSVGTMEIKVNPDGTLSNIQLRGRYNGAAGAAVTYAAEEYVRRINEGIIPKNPEIANWQYVQDPYARDRMQAQRAVDPVNRAFDGISRLSNYDWRERAQVEHVFRLWTGQRDYNLAMMVRNQAPPEGGAQPLSYLNQHWRDAGIEGVINNLSTQEVIRVFDPNSFALLVRGARAASDYTP